MNSSFERQKSRFKSSSAADTPLCIEDSGLVSIRLKEIIPLYQDVEIRSAASRYLAEAPRIHSPEQVVSLFGFLEFETRENFFALHLDSKHHILCLDQISVGSLSASIVHPREVFKSALVSSAAALVFVHNHPSGDPTPSREDKSIHTRLVEAGKLLGINVLDHLVIGRKGSFISMTQGTEGDSDGAQQDCQIAADAALRNALD